MLAALRIAALLTLLVIGVVAKQDIGGGTRSPTDWDMPDLDGRPHRLDEWQGRVVVVSFWATWCGNCLAEWSELNAAQQDWHTGAGGPQIVGVALDDEAATVVRFLAAHPASYPILHGAENGWLWSERLGNRERVLPFSVIFDRHGRAVFRQMGLFNRQELQAIVSPLLR